MEHQQNQWEWAGYGQTDPGLVRTTNQDSFLVDNRRRLWAVADGMGGHPGGEVASRLVVDILADFAPTLCRSIDSAHNHAEQQGRFLLTTMAEQAHTAVRSHAERNRAVYGMGTTLVMAHLLPLSHPRLLVLNVGDSRAYLIRADTIIQLTRDHTLLEDSIRDGRLTPAQAAHHPDRHVLTRAMGVGPTLESDLFSSDLQNGDLLLLCSDGLTTMLTDEEILNTVRPRLHDAHDSTQALIRAAIERGGIDNVTVVTCSVVDTRKQTNRH